MTNENNDKKILDKLIIIEKTTIQHKNEYDEDTRSPKAKMNKRINVFSFIISLFLAITGFSAFTVIDFIQNNDDQPETEDISSLPETEDISSLPETEDTSPQQEIIPDDTVITWKDEKFGEMIKAEFEKEEITYADIKNVKDITIYGDNMFVDNLGYDIFGACDDDNWDTMQYRYKGKDYPLSNYISLDDLTNFDSLESFSIFYYKNIDCSVFEEEQLINGITFLEIWNTKLDSEQMNYIAKLKNLESLQLHKTTLEPFHAKTISRLVNLKKLRLCDMEIDDLFPLKNLKNLTHLTLTNDNINSIEALQYMDNLELVVLFHNPINDWSPVEHVKTVIKTEDQYYEYYAL